MAVQPAGCFEQGGGVQHVASAHTLRPADPAVKGEAPIVLGHVVECADGGRGVSEVSRDDVRRDLDSLGVEHEELLALPLFVGAEVDGGAESRRLVGVLGEVVLCRRNTLEAVHDVDGVSQGEGLVYLVETMSAHPEDDVRDATRLEGLDEAVERSACQDLALVVVSEEMAERRRIQRTAQDDVLTNFVESSSEDSHDVSHDAKSLSVGYSPTYEGQPTLGCLKIR